MGVRKHIRAEQLNEARKNKFFARLNNCPTSPRKMRLVADLIKGMNVEKALHVLKKSPKESSNRLHKLLLSAIATGRLKTRVLELRTATYILRKYMLTVQGN